MPTPLPQTCAHNRTCGHFPSPPEIKAPTLDHSANPEKAAARGGILLWTTGGGLSKKYPTSTSPGLVACCGSYRQSDYTASRLVTRLGAITFGGWSAPRYDGLSRISPTPRNSHCMRLRRGSLNRLPQRRLS